MNLNGAMLGASSAGTWWPRDRSRMSATWSKSAGRCRRMAAAMCAARPVNDNGANPSVHSLVKVCTLNAGYARFRSRAMSAMTEAL